MNRVMIGDGIFAAQLELIEAILKGLSLLEERMLFPNKGIGAGNFRGLGYRDVYMTYVSESIYDFKLVDQSLLLFVKEGTDHANGKLSYSFTEAPADVVSYSEFVANEMEVAFGSAEHREAVEFLGDELRPDYETYVGSVGLKEAVTPIRYDYLAKDYRAGVHPASHVHLGFGSNVRLGSRTVLNPIAFLCFIVRQRYPRHWVIFKGIEKFKHHLRNIRDHLDLVDNLYWTSADEEEMFLR